MYLTERNNGGAKKKAWLDKKSWMAMSQEDRSVWDQLSDSAKATIRSAYQNAPSNGNRRPFPPRRSSVNTHELQDLNEGKEDNETEETTTLGETEEEDEGFPLFDEPSHTDTEQTIKITNIGFVERSSRR